MKKQGNVRSIFFFARKEQGRLRKNIKFNLIGLKINWLKKEELVTHLGFVKLSIIQIWNCKFGNLAK